MRINIELIEHADQRYPTAGDWWLDDDDVLQVRASLMGDRRLSALVVLHELVEVLIEGMASTRDLAVPRQLVRATDTFDQTYEAERHPDDVSSEPGYSPQCPVYQGHMVASAVEHLAAMLMSIDYNEYQREIEEL